MKYSIFELLFTTIMVLKKKILITGILIILTISNLFIYWMKSREDTFADD